jgi:hypothetical protein
LNPKLLEIKVERAHRREKFGPNEKAGQFRPAFSVIVVSV